MEQEHWDIVIKPRATFFNLNLKEVWRYRDLLMLFVRRDFIAQYKQTILGPLWHFIQPLLTTVMFLFIFRKIAKIPTDGIPPVLFYLSGITIWNYFTACFLGTSNVFVSNAGIFGKVYFPRLVIPLATIVSNMVKLGIQFLLLIAVMIYYNFHGYPFHLSWALLMLPVLILMIALLGLGVGILFSGFTTKYRDLSLLVGFVMQLAMYATPVVYPLSFLKDKSYKWVININPLTPIVEGFRYALLGKGSFTIKGFEYSSIIIIVMLFLGTLIFNKVEKTFIDTV